MFSVAPLQKPMLERLWRNVQLARMTRAASGIDVVHDGAVLVRGERIVFAGAECDLPAHGADCEVIDCEGRWITPGLIDCHTHLVHAGNRANEFEMRLRGATYQEIAAAGGGILSSVRATRAATVQQLVDPIPAAARCADRRRRHHIEIKSGYGLDLENENAACCRPRANSGACAA
jgi:imidazolonepropionase